MAKRGQFVGNVSEDGKLFLFNQGGYTGFLKHLAGKRVTLTIGEDKPTRSSNQHRYYFGVVVKTIAEELGYTSDELHEALKYKFLRLEAEPDKFRPLVSMRSTTSLKTDEFEQFLEQVRIWAATDLGIVVPLPNE